MDRQQRSPGSRGARARGRARGALLHIPPIAPPVAVIPVGRGRALPARTPSPTEQERGAGRGCVQRVRTTMAPPLVGIGRGLAVSNLALLGPTGSTVVSGAGAVADLQATTEQRDGEWASVMEALESVPEAPQTTRRPSRGPPILPPLSTSSSASSSTDAEELRGAVGAQPRWRCGRCGRGFRHENTLKTHKELCMQTCTIQCVECGHWSYDRENLQDHQAHEHHRGQRMLNEGPLNLRDLPVSTPTHYGEGQ